MIVLDTCAIIDLLSGKGKSEEIRNIIQTQSVAVSAISINELLVNAHQQKKQIITEFIRSVHILAFDQETAFMSVELEDELTLKGGLRRNPAVQIASSGQNSILFFKRERY